MKTSVLFLAILASVTISKAQAPVNLSFSSPSLESGSSLSVGATYRFPSVKANVDALVKIKARSSSSVNITSIDQSGSGYGSAFQPQINYNGGNSSGAVNYYVDFEIKFVTANTTTPVAVSFNVTALDIDGDNNTLREYDAFYSPSPNSYTVEGTSLLTTSNFMQGASNVGKQFTGPTTLYVLGVDTSTKNIMATMYYNNVTMFNFRAGASATASSSQTNRMYSAWFRNFTYNAPLVILPVKLSAFNVSLLNAKAELRWETSSEINASHFIVQRSLDGTTYHDAGLVFAAGNTTDVQQYIFRDDLSNISSKVVYYRLCTVDIDGKREYSDVRMIRMTGFAENKIRLQAFPNPVTSELRVTIPAEWQNKEVVYEVFQLNGQSVSRKINSNAGQTQTIDMHSMSRGIYVVVASCADQKATERIVKQ